MTEKQVQSDKPIFEMSKKKLMTGMTDRMLGLVVAGLLYWGMLGFKVDLGHFTLESLVPVFVLVGVLFLVQSGMHDLLVRGIRCYDDHLEVQGVFVTTKLVYSDIKSFTYTYTGMGTAATVLRLDAPVNWAMKESNSKQFTNEELARLAFLLRSHGVQEIKK